MGFEPRANSRLGRVWATTRDAQLRQELGTILEDPAMSFVPSSELMQQIRSCPECESAITLPPSKNAMTPCVSTAGVGAARLT